MKLIAFTGTDGVPVWICPDQIEAVRGTTDANVVAIYFVSGQISQVVGTAEDVVNLLRKDGEI